MKVSHYEQFDSGIALRTFRDALWPASLAVIAMILLPVFGCGWLWQQEFELPEWLMLAPFLLAGAFFYVLIFPAALHAMAALLRPTNWRLKVTAEGLYLNLRSYLNHHVKDGQAMVAFIPYAEIVEAGRVTRQVEAGTAQRTGKSKKYLELTLKSDTGSLKRYATEEIHRRPRQEGFSSIWFHDKSVRVPSPGKVWISWRPGMLKALSDFVPVSASQSDSVPNDVQSKSHAGQVDRERLILDLLESGEKLSAVTVAREKYDMSLEQALRFVEELQESERGESVS